MPADSPHLNGASGWRRSPALLGSLRAFARYARELPSFLRNGPTPEEARQRIERQLRVREESFVRLLERGVYAYPSSPYRKLLESAGVELGDVVHLVGEAGLEGALDRLYESGVHVTLDEFKGRKPIERSGLSLAVEPRDFDNPLLTEHYTSTTSGSTGVPRRVTIDLEHQEHETAYQSLFHEAFALSDRPIGVWRPSVTGMNNCLRQAKLGHPVERWLTPSKLPFTSASLKFSLVAGYAVIAGRLCGAGFPRPEYCAAEEASRVARWLAATKRDRAPAVLLTPPGLGVRVALAAEQEGIDISDSFFRLGGEPYTEGKARVLRRAGVQAVCNYAMAEIGRVGTSCAAPAALDDVHVLSDKLAVVQRNKEVGANAVTVGAFCYTTLLSSCPKLMINVESDDYGVAEERACGCPFGELGLSLHLHGIRSYEKLTSEATTFLGSDLIGLVDEVLPARFGGEPTDYQLVEEEDAGLSKVSIVVRPSLGPIEHDEVVSTALAFLHSEPLNREMVQIWRKLDTLRVVRREPYTTKSAKILPLHLLRPPAS